MRDCTESFCPIDHICIDTSDVFGMIDFFEHVFGMTVCRTQGPEGAPTNVWLDGGVQLRVVENATAEYGRYDHIAFQCLDLDAVLDRARAYGAEAVEGKGRHWFRAMDIAFEMKVQVQ